MKVKSKIIKGINYYEIYDINDEFISSLCEYENRTYEVRFNYILNKRWRDKENKIKFIDLTIEELKILKSLHKINDKILYNMYLEIFNKKFNNESYSN